MDGKIAIPIACASPTSTAFNSSMNWNFTNMTDEDARVKPEGTIDLLFLAAFIFLKPAEAWRTLGVELRSWASSWQLVLMNRLYFVENGTRVTFDFCMAGMFATNKGEILPTQKPTGIVTNSSVGREVSTISMGFVSGPRQHPGWTAAFDVLLTMANRLC